MDGREPDCQGAKGCKVVPLEAEAGRILRLHGALKGIGGLVGPDAILEAHGATSEDFDALQAIEHELNEIQAERKAEGR